MSTVNLHKKGILAAGGPQKSVKFDAIAEDDRDNEVAENRVRCREERAGCCSRFFFTWVTPTINTAQKKFLVENDLPYVAVKDEAVVFADGFNERWETQQAEAKEGKAEPPTLQGVIMKMFKRDFFKAGGFKLIHDCFSYFTPVLLNWTVQFIEEGTEFKVGLLSLGYIYAIALALGQVIQSLVLNQYFHGTYRMGMNMRCTIITTVYQKSLKISMATEHDTSTGQIVNLMSNDAQRMQMFMAYIHNIWSSPLQIIVAFSLLFYYIGASALVGLFVLLLSLPTKGVFLKKISKVRKVVVGITDSRVKLINDVLQGIKVIKFYGWEGSFLQEITRTRNAEMVALRKFIGWESINNTMWNLTPMLVALSTFAVYAATGGDLRPSTIFTALFLFQKVRFPVIMFPFILQSLIDFKVAAKRITDFLNKEEVGGLAALARDDGQVGIDIEGATFAWRNAPAGKSDEKDGKSDGKDGKSDGKKKAADTKEIVLEEGKEDDGSAEPLATESGFQMEDLDFKATSGELVAVVGGVGSGKSSLVSAMLGEMECSKGKVSVGGSVAYVPQIPWVLNATVRDNVTFSASFDQVKYDEAMKLSQLELDMTQLPSGDQTLIGERGINLSGGQKQRVALARALYADRDIYILDDPLSALDVHITAEVFSKLIRNRLKNKLVILVTHNLDLLSSCSRIVCLENGKVTDNGSFKQLMNSSDHFKSFMEAHGVEAKKTSHHSTTEEGKTEEKVKGPKDEMKKETVKKEERATGSVTYKTIASYARAFNPCLPPLLTMFSVLFMYASVNVLQIGANYWLAHWTSEANSGGATEDDTGYYLGVYAAWTAGALFAYMVVSFLFSVGAIGASSRLHKGMLQSLLRAPMWWFDTTPSGRTLSRCSKDVDEADSQLRSTVQMMLRCLLEVVSVLALVTWVTQGWLGIPLFPVLCIYLYIMQRFRRTSRELQRLDSVSKSPIFNNFSETLQGLSSVRAYGVQSRFHEKNLSNLDVNDRAYFLVNAANRWLSIRLELNGAILTLCLTSILVYLRMNVDMNNANNFASDGALAGLALVYMSEILNTLNWGVRQVSEVEMRMNAVERLLEYQGGDFPSEAADELPDDPDSDDKWPTEGKIDITDFQMRYREGLPLALNKCTLSVPPGSSVGICGRTGSGKSSLMVALLRLAEKAGGKIEIDGRDIHKMGLQAIRSRMAIIPQDPVLFLGTIRSNLDPFNRYDDEAIWEAIKTCQMYEAVSNRPNGLESPVSEGGSNFSMGERQLLCIARAMLRKPKLLLLDEATASIDRTTDRIIQDMLRTVFKQCTTLIIAHRLNTIMDCDFIAVIDSGKCAEFAPPSKLLENPASAFTSMVKNTEFGQPKPEANGANDDSAAVSL